jgi:hypothetical protein
VLTGSLLLVAASGLARCPRRTVGSRLVPVLVGATGAGQIGSGVIVTDPIGGFPPPSSDRDGTGTTAPARSPLSWSGAIHNFCAIPIFVGIPLTASCPPFPLRRGRYRWAGYSLAPSLVMVASFVRRRYSQGTTPMQAHEVVGSNRWRLETRTFRQAPWRSRRASSPARL